MEKRLSLAGLCACLCTLLFLFSCSKKTEYLQTIPSDAAFVVTFDLKSLSQKGNVADWIKAPQNASLMNALNSGMSESLLKLWKNMLEDPGASGLSFTDEWACFGILEPNPIFGVLAKVSDFDKWENIMNTLAAEGLATPISEESNVASSTIGQKVKCLFDKDRVLWVFGSASTGILENKIALEWFAQEGEECLVSNKEFLAFLENQKDINYWYCMNALPTFIRSAYTSYLPDGILLGSLYSVGYCDFQKGKISMTAQLLSGDKDTMDKLKDVFKISGKQSGKFVKQIPAKSLYTVGINLDGEKLYKLISSLPGLTQTQLNMIQSEETKNVINSIDGDFLLSIIGMSANSSVPDMALFAQVDDDYVVELLKNNLGIFGVKEIGKNRYKLNLENNSIYFGIENKKDLFVTNSEQVFQNINGRMPDSMSKTPYASVFNKSPYGIVINLKEGLDAAFSSGRGAYFLKQYASVLEQVPFTCLAVSGTGLESNLDMYFSDDKVNSVASILEWITVLASQTM